jgi:hypothetical protein
MYMLLKMVSAHSHTAMEKHKKMLSAIVLKKHFKLFELYNIKILYY